MLSSPDTLRGALATSASALVEATPFLLGGVVFARVLRARNLVAFVGCGCASGPSARSLPAAAATWLLFGPAVAIARFAAGVLVARALRGSCGRHGDDRAPDLLGELHAVLPAALTAGASVQLLARWDLAALPPLESALGGALLGFFAAPCGIGAIALAGTLRVHAPAAAAAFLSVAGIADLRALRLHQAHRATSHDAFAYLLLSAALSVVAARHGDALVRPALAVPLWLCGAASLFAAAFYRRRHCPLARIAPALMLAGALAAAPPPVYHATETTMTDLFAGERLTFEGMLSCSRSGCALVRYAITCCRADAAPIAIGVERIPAALAGDWLRVEGRIDDAGQGLRLVPWRVDRIAPPADPFVYR